MLDRELVRNTGRSKFYSKILFEIQLFAWIFENYLSEMHANEKET